MSQISFYIKKAKTLVVPNFFYTTVDNGIYRPAYESLNKQVEKLGVDCSVNLVDFKDIPTKTNSFLVCFLDENSLVPDDYVARILSMNNLHRDMAMMCGPVSTISNATPADWFVATLAKFYKSYSLDGFGTFISSYLNNDPNNYPPIEGCIFSGQHYNSCGGYNPVFSPRALITKDSVLLSNIDKSGPMIFSERLGTINYIPVDEYQVKNFTDYYYQLGYYDGSIGNEFNSKIIELTYNAKYNSEVSPDNKKKYLEMVETLKCAYIIGRTEAIVKNNII